MADAVPLSRALRRLRLLTLPAVLTAFGLQLLRVLFPSLVWYLREVRGLAPPDLLTNALWVCLGGLVAAVLWYRLQDRLTLTVTAVAVVALRLAEQVNHEPALDFPLSLVGSAAFVAFLTAWLGHLRSAPSMLAGPHGAEGVFLGLVLDSGLKGMGNTLDMSWFEGPVPLAAIAGLGLLSLFSIRGEVFPAGQRPTDPTWRNALPLAAIGPFLFLQLMVFQNSGWVSTVGGVSSRIAFPLVMLGNVALCAGLLLGFARPATLRPALAALAAVYLAGAGLYLSREGLGFVGILLSAQVVMGWAWAVLGTASGLGQRKGLFRLGTSQALGAFVLIVSTFAYYAGLETPLPLPRDLLFPITAGLFGLCLVASSTRAALVPRTPRPDPTVLRGSIGLGLLFTVLFGLMATARPPLQENSRPLRIMTYNIHSAFDVTGSQDPEAIAALIEASGADIVALQEASRGWLINGSTDLGHWLSHRLQMKLIFTGTSDPVWGNAILTRVPLDSWGSGPLPRGSALIERGYLWVESETEDGVALRLINTHFHAVEGEGSLRQLQASAVLEVWDGKGATVIMGDLNAQPGSGAIHRLLRAGFVDSWAGATGDQAATYPSHAPARRIDWILHTRDLNLTRVEILHSIASDHLPLVASVEPPP